MYCSYKDALLLGKPTEQPVKQQAHPKKVYKVYTTSEIKKMCIWGKISELKTVNPNYFNSENITILVSLMKEKIIEIENWKYEDQNQFDGVIQEFNERIEGISKCLEYVNTFIKTEDKVSANEDKVSTNEDKVSANEKEAEITHMEKEDKVTIKEKVE